MSALALQEEAMKRKVQLARGFKSLASTIGQTSNTGEGSKAAGTAAANQAKAPAAPAADEWEVARVLHSKNDYECLQVCIRFILMVLALITMTV
jgi:hypothetical protein